jgi:hypothetical protein
MQGRPPVVGSGYQITGGTVLTATHVVRDTPASNVAIQCHQAGWIRKAIDSVDLGDDLTLLFTKPITAPGGTGRSPVLGALGASAQVLDATTVGYPAFQLKSTAADGTAIRHYRDVTQIPGEIATLSGTRSGTVTFHVDAAYQPPVPSRQESAWQGLSGASLFAGRHLVGVITSDPSPDRPATLTATRIDRTIVNYGTRNPDDLIRLCDALGLTTPELPDASSGVPHHLNLLAHRLAALDRLPEGGVVGRGRELEQMGRFCAAESGPSYFTWQAEAWSGKTALMTEFVAEPPAGLDIVSFFTNNLFAGQRESANFLASITGQLDSIINDTFSSGIRTPGAATGDLLRLIEAANDTSIGNGRRLVLLVDALDEDVALGGSSARDQMSITSILPHKPPPGMRIITSTRPSALVDDQVLDDHPFRHADCRHDLKPSVNARVQQNAVSQEIRKATGTKGIDRDIVGYLACAQGGLTAEEIAELVNDARPDSEIAPVEVLGRLAAGLRRCTRPVSGMNGTGSIGRVFEFSHSTVPDRVRVDIGARMVSRYTEEVHRWAERHSHLGWHDETPQYLIRYYPALLRDTANLDVLLTYALDVSRQDWLLRVRGGDDQAMVELDWASQLNSAVDPINLKNALSIAVRRSQIRRRNAMVHFSLPSVYAAVGDHSRALSLAESIPDTYRRDQALKEIVLAEIIGADTNDIRAIIFRIATPQMRSECLAELALSQFMIDADAGARSLGTAVETANGVRNLHRRAETLLRIATRACALMDNVEVSEILRSAFVTAQEAARTGASPPYAQQELLASIAVCQASVAKRWPEGMENARETAERIRDPQGKVVALAAIARAESDGSTASELLDRAQSICDRIPDLDRRMVGLVALAEARAASDPTAALVTAARIPKDEERLTALLAIAEQAAPHTEASARALAAAQTILHREGVDPAHRVRQLIAFLRTEKLIGAPESDLGDLLARAISMLKDITVAAQAVDAAILIGNECMENGLRTEGAELFTRAIDQIMTVDSRTQTQLLPGIARAQAAANIRDDAIRTVEMCLSACRTVAGQISLTADVAAKATVTDVDPSDSIAQIERVTMPYQRALRFAELALAHFTRGAAAAGAEAIRRALAAVDLVSGPDQTAMALIQIAKAQLPSNRSAAVDTLDAAMRASREISDLYRRTRTLTRTGQAQFDAEVEGVQQAFAEAIRQADRIENDQERAAALAYLGAARTSSGDVSGGADSLTRAIAIANRMSNGAARAETLAEIVRIQASSGDPDGASTTAAMIEDLTAKDSALQMISEALAQAKALDRALSTALQIGGTAKRCAALHKVATSAIENNHERLARQALALGLNLD